MARPDLDQTLWQPWIDHLCAGLGVDPALIDVREIHGLSGEVASLFARPMAPVSVHLWAIARGRFPDADPGELRRKIVAVAQEMS